MFFFSDALENMAIEPMSIEHGYLAILNDDLASSRAVFEKIDSPRGRWGRAFVEILGGYIEHFPSYFEIRNFYEIDLDFLIKNEKFNYVENLLSALKLLTGINQEVYKYTARVLYENKMYNASLEYMEKAKESFYRDPELHFMLAKFYLNSNQLTEANYYIDECLKVVPSYHPALKIKAEISKKL